MTIKELSQTIAEEISDYVYASDGTPEKDCKVFSEIIQKNIESAVGEEELELATETSSVFKSEEEYEEAFPNGILNCDEGQGDYT